MLKSLIVLLFTFLVACSKPFVASPKESSAAADLAIAKSKWTSAKINVGPYELSLGHSGVWGYLKVISAVSKLGLVTNCTEAYREWNEINSTYSSCSTESGSTIEDLFSKIELAIATGSLSSAEYDSMSGVPIYIFIKSNNDEIADSGKGYSVQVEFNFAVP